MGKNIPISPQPGLTFSPAVKRGNLLFISGLTGVSEETKGDMAAQTELIFQKMKALLEEAGATFDNVVWTTDYMTTLEDYNKTADIRRKYLPNDAFSAATGVVVKRLIRGAALIEIDAIAVLD
jgi:enamine deaminase RidA (YjgF/YER057c/UK114 family)